MTLRSFHANVVYWYMNCMIPGHQIYLFLTFLLYFRQIPKLSSRVAVVDHICEKIVAIEISICWWLPKFAWEYVHSPSAKMQNASSKIVLCQLLCRNDKHFHSPFAKMWSTSSKIVERLIAGWAVWETLQDFIETLIIIHDVHSFCGMTVFMNNETRSSFLYPSFAINSWMHHIHIIMHSNHQILYSALDEIRSTEYWSKLEYSVLFSWQTRTRNSSPSQARTSNGGKSSSSGAKSRSPQNNASSSSRPAPRTQGGPKLSKPLTVTPRVSQRPPTENAKMTRKKIRWQLPARRHCVLDL